MGCGFSFPETDQLDSVNIFAGEGSVGEILYRMAAYKLKRPELIKSTENGREEKIYSPSLFHEEGLLYAGQQISKYYFVTWNEEQAASSGLLKKMGNRPVEVLTFDRLIQLKEGGKQSGKTFDL